MVIFHVTDSYKLKDNILGNIGNINKKMPRGFCEEPGMPGCYKVHLSNAKSDSTVLTKAFTGRLASGLRNKFIDNVVRYENEALDFPIQNRLTRPIRQAATKQQDTEFMSLWAGEGVVLAKNQSVKMLMQSLIDAM